MITPVTYEHRPTRVEAAQWHGDYDALPVAWRASGMFHMQDGELDVATTKGMAPVSVGDYIVRSQWGTYWPIEEPVFLSNYKAVQ